MEPKHVRTQLSITLSDIAMLVIAIFVILAYFKGWGGH